MFFLASLRRNWKTKRAFKASYQSIILLSFCNCCNWKFTCENQYDKCSRNVMRTVPKFRQRDTTGEWQAVKEEEASCLMAAHEMLWSLWKQTFLEVPNVTASELGIPSSVRFEGKYCSVHAVPSLGEQISDSVSGRIKGLRVQFFNHVLSLPFWEVRAKTLVLWRVSLFWKAQAQQCHLGLLYSSMHFHSPNVLY